LDGASQWNKFWSITLPLITPVILYDVVIGLGLGLQVFAPSYIITSGGPVNSTLFYVYYLYNQAFRYGGQVGYASALSWVLFVLSVVLAAGVFYWSRRWVNYEVGT
jgi:multiple sugar transport system permease protein